MPCIIAYEMNITGIGLLKPTGVIPMPIGTAAEITLADVDSPTARSVLHLLDERDVAVCTTTGERPATTGDDVTGLRRVTYRPTGTPLGIRPDGTAITLDLKLK